ncbi:MAG: succinate dehydrogenase assembly factor 2 [Pseudomonadota bacterium]
MTTVNRRSDFTTAMSGSKPVSAPLDVRRKKLIYRASHRGTRELDLILGGYVSRHIADMDEAQLNDLERIIDIPDVDLDAWLSGKRKVPDAQNSKLLTAILTFSYTPSDYV